MENISLRAGREVYMDVFMDKLAQRLTAQDIIQANTAADTEEMNKLKLQIAEYHQCLAQLQKLLDEETAKLRNSQVSGDNVNRLVEEGIAKIRSIQSAGSYEAAGGRTAGNHGASGR